MNDQLAALKTELQLVKAQRESQREVFVRNQADLVDRQCFVSQKLNRLQHAKMVSPAQYTHVIKNLSANQDCRYCLTKEAEVCYALHQIEIYTKQLNLIKIHCEEMTESLRKKLQEEISLSEKLEADLLSSVKFLSIDMTGLIVEHQAILDEQNHTSSCSTEDKKCLLASSYHVSTNAVAQDQKNRTCINGIRNNNSSLCVEERVTKVSSYFGVYQTAHAA